MTFCKALLAFLFWVPAAGVAHIQAPGAVMMAPGSSATVPVTVVVDSGFHIQSDHPKLDYLIPTSITLDATPAVNLTKVDWPPTKEYHFGFSDQPLSVFSGTIPVKMRLEAKVGAGTYDVSGRFRYQACNEQSCRPPVTEPFRFEVKIR